MSILRLLWRTLDDWLDPVCQNRSAVILGKYQGYCVRLRPIVGRSGRVEAWVPDPADAERIDRILASGAAPSPTVTAPPPVLPVPSPSPSPSPSLPPPLPGGASAPFNPAGVPGI